MHLSSSLPNLAWLQTTRLLLNTSYSLFSVSQQIGHSFLLDWLASRVLQLAHRTFDSAEGGHLRREKRALRSGEFGFPFRT